MDIVDLRLIENKDGGDCVLNGNDLEMISGFQNMPYIGMFGGNVEQSTLGPKTTEETFDFWGNFLFHPTEQPIWFNSKTELLLKSVALTSSGRIQIQEQVKKDISFMELFSQITVSVSLITVDKVQISIKIQEPNNLQSTDLIYIWDATQQELTQ